MNFRKPIAGIGAAFAASTLTPSVLLCVVVLGIALAAFLAIAQAAPPPESQAVAPVSLQRLEATYAQLREQKVRYGYGVKANDFAPDRTLAGADISRINAIDCSGLVRFGAYVASDRKLVMPDGSQVQEEWARKKGLHRVKKYSDVAAYMNPKRLFVAFIKPYKNGCGSVGHVWFIRMRKGKVVTVESHGGVGVNSRPWNTPVLKRQVFSVYELPATP